MRYLLKLFPHRSTYIIGYNVPSRLTHRSMFKKDIKMAFQTSLPKIISNVLREKKYCNTTRMADKIQKAAEYNLKTENNIGSVTLLHSYSVLEKTENIKDESLQQAFVLAWGVEMVHSYTLMIENIAALETNRDVLLTADLLRSFMYLMLENFFGSNILYNDLLQIYNKALVYNTLAREIQHGTPQSDKYQDFTEARYDLLCEYKTAYQSLTLPFMVAMKLANKTDEKILKAAEKLCFEMGKLYQMKKDFNDCFGKEVLIGTTGTDIQRRKCTWLAVAALQRFSQPQRLVFSTCYGGDGPAHIERVKLLYKQVNLPQVFKQQEADMVESIKQKAEELEKDGVPSAVFLKILDDILI